jgi:hypothetical protein
VDLEALRLWLVPSATAFSLIAAGLGSFSALMGYRIKAKSEARLAAGQAVELDIKLLQTFSEIMDIAHARRGSYISDAGIAKAIEVISATSEPNLDPEKIKDIFQKV